MASLIRSRQAGIQNDLSAGIASDFFLLDDLARFGVNSQVSALAYDPVQSLLAVGTRTSAFGPGQIYVFGQKRVCVALPPPPRGASVQVIQFCAEKLICLDSKHDITIFSLESKKLLVTHSPPGVVTAICSDPTLDYILIGLQTGEIIAYDIDREAITAFRVPNLFTEIDPRARATPILSLQLHPKDIGTLLIGYAAGAVVYSFKQNKALRHYKYEIPPGAPGGDADPKNMRIARRPRLTHATWHPSGTFVLTGYEDSSLVFWDVLKDGRMLAARTRTDAGIARTGSMPASLGEEGGLKEPLFRIAWCANGQNPDDTGLLIAGGASMHATTRGLCFLELGPTPMYATSNWESLSAHFDSPRRQRILPTPPGAEVVNFCLIPRTSPHFAGAHDPIAIIALLNSGELLTLSFPSGIPISPTNQLHVGLSFIHPFLQKLNVTPTDRARWLGMTESRQQGPLISRGGVGAQYPMRRYERRNVVQAAHKDGTIRLWDLGHGDEIENDKVVQVDVARALGRFDRLDLSSVSLSGESGELAVGTRAGEVVAFRWGRNRNAGREAPPSQPGPPGHLADVSANVEPSLTEGLLPFTMLDQQNGPATVVKMSDVGFVAAGFEGGDIVVIDLRGPAVIFATSVQGFPKSEKHASIRRRANSTTQPDWAVQMEFSVMTLEGEQWSSISLHVGTHQGHLATFKILPDSSGRYSVQYGGSVNLESRIIHIHPINTDSGKAAYASQQAVAALRSGGQVNGALVVATLTSIHVFRPATSKGAHKSFDGVFCDACGVARYQDLNHAIVALFGDGTARAYSIPALKEIAVIRLHDVLDVRRFPEATITSSGNIIAFTGPSEVALLSIFGSGERLVRDKDELWNPAALIPPRPTISAVSWVTGTQYVTPLDLDVLIGGPGRPPSKRMIAQQQAEDAQRLTATATGVRAGNSNVAQQDEGYWSYMQRQVQERTQKLNFIGDSMNNLEESSQNWANDVNKFVGRQKRNAATGIIKARFGI